ncbi:MAG TPA: hypothetical protein DER52_09525 [Glaciecola sp.]|nr:hypothetical protein [Glaciecola sp.]
MKKIKLSMIASSVLFGLTLVGCGGGASSDNNITPVTPTPTPTPDPVVIKTGIITGFGSIHIDGKRYLTDNAEFTVNGQAGSNIDQLHVGMKVSIATNEVDSETPEAVSVNYAAEIEGVITSIDRNNQQIFVSGTTVTYSDLTHFIQTTENLLTVGDRIEVNGYPAADGTYLATAIKLDADTNNVADSYTTGTISNLDTTAQTFSLNALTINYASAIIEGTLLDGQLAKVEGVVLDSIMNATEIEILSIANIRGQYTDDISAFEIEGLVTALDLANNTLAINGLSVLLGAQVSYQDGVAADLQVGQFIEVKLGQNDEVVGIQFERNEYYIDGKVKGSIEAIDLTNNTLTLNGQVYHVTATTRFEDDDDQYINLAGLQLNDLIEVVFSQNNEQNMIQRIEREREQEFDNEWEIEGRTTAWTDSSITVNGITITLSDTIRYINNDFVVTKADFIALLAEGVYVEAEGGIDAQNEILLHKIEIEAHRSSNDDNNDDGNSGDNDDNNSNDNSSNDERNQGYVELEGRVTQLLSESSFMLQGVEVRLNDNAKLELNDLNVDILTFMAQITVGSRIEIEGQWVDNLYIDALEAEIEQDDN